MEKYEGKNLYQIIITLIGSKPPIWRRLIVPSTIHLNNLHMVIQLAMGWKNCHLYSFSKGRYYNPSYQEVTGYSDLEDSNIADSSKITLDKLLYTVGDNIIYNYDFGVDWNHKIILEKSSLPGQEFPHIPICIKGKGTCPVEDSNFGFAQKLEDIEFDDLDGFSREDLEKMFLNGIDERKYNLESINQRLIKLSSQNGE